MSENESDNALAEAIRSSKSLPPSENTMNKLFKMYMYDHNGNVTTAPATAKTERKAMLYFTKRICGGTVCAEPLESEDIEEWDETLESNPIRTLEASASEQGFKLAHVAIQGEMMEWYGEGYRKPVWKLFAYCFKPMDKE